MKHIIVITQRGVVVDAFATKQDMKYILLEDLREWLKLEPHQAVTVVPFSAVL